MIEKKNTTYPPENGGISYEIKVKGNLDEQWTDWLGGLEITRDGEHSLLTGVVPDQAALHGILNQIRDLGLPLISISPQVKDTKEKEKQMKTNETSHNSHYAGFAKRLKAFAFDYLIICGYLILLTGVTMTVIKISSLFGVPLQWPENPVLADLMAFVTLVLPVVLYFTFQESSSKQSTWGKRKAGIRVVNANGDPLTRGQALARSLVKVIPWQIAHTCLVHIPGWPMAITTVPSVVVIGFILVYVLAGIYIAAVLISKKNRTPYDWVSGSYVIVEG